MKIQFFGHSCVMFTTAQGSLLVDPFLQGNPVNRVPLEDINPDVVVITHGHGDHFGNALELEAKGAKLISSVEVIGYAQKQGAKNVVGMNIGGTYRSTVGSIKFTPAWHSSSLPDGSYGGMPMGVILELGGKKIYHTGDTALFSDMSLIGKAGIDLAFVCCGDHYTMGVDDALEAVKFIQPKALVPIHHSTFGLIAQDAEAFCAKAEALGVKGYPLKPGEILTV
jgi:L-ascorbate metabolism protein UlaG (beta-lactamase superfamily)